MKSPWNHRETHRGLTTATEFFRIARRIQQVAIGRVSTNSSEPEAGSLVELWDEQIGENHGENQGKTMGKPGENGETIGKTGGKPSENGDFKWKTRGKL